MDKIRNAITSFCEDNEYKYNPDYSGRNMYGKSCVGIVSENDPVFVAMQLLAYLCDCYGDENDLTAEGILEMIGTPRADSMGLGSIVYFPKIKSI
ncbi:MAG: hypothetical protein AB7D36_05465 [Oscillospiraceae bacterium]